MTARGRPVRRPRPLRSAQAQSSPTSKAQGLLVEHRGLHAQPSASASAARPSSSRSSPRSGSSRSKPLAEKAIDAVERRPHRVRRRRTGRKTYFEWMYNIRDWCISRQLWWGHRIPAWHCAACHKITVAREDPTQCAHCGSDKTRAGHRRARHLVLLRPAARLDLRLAGHHDGKPRDFDAFYPTSLLVTGFDILFFWVARMIMLGCEFMRDVPMPDGSAAHARRMPCPSARSTSTAWCATPTARRCRRPRATSSIRSRSSKQYGTDAVRFALASHGRARHRHRLHRSAHRRLPRLRQQDLERRPLPLHAARTLIRRGRRNGPRRD